MALETPRAIAERLVEEVCQMGYAPEAGVDPWVDAIAAAIESDRARPHQRKAMTPRITICVEFPEGEPLEVGVDVPVGLTDASFWSDAQRIVTSVRYHLQHALWDRYRVQRSHWTPPA